MTNVNETAKTLALTGSPSTVALMPMSTKEISLVQEAEAFIGSLPQITLTTEHILHAGVYSRTVLIQKGETIVGALIKRSTNLILSGHALIYLGETGGKEYKGYAVLTASAHRKQVFVALEDTYLTMSFATEATTIEQAEDEFTDEGKMLMSRQEGSINHITITGE